MVLSLLALLGYPSIAPSPVSTINPVSMFRSAVRSEIEPSIVLAQSPNPAAGAPVSGQSESGNPGAGQSPSRSQAASLTNWDRCRQQWQAKQLEAALNFCQGALEQARQRGGDREMEGRILTSLGILYRSLGQPSQSMQALGESVAIYRQIRNAPGLSMALFYWGQGQTLQGNFDRAIAAYQEGLRHIPPQQDWSKRVHFLFHLSGTYTLQGKLDKAIATYQEILTQARKWGDRESEFSALNGLGSSYTTQGNYAKAIEYHQQSLQQAEAGQAQFPQARLQTVQALSSLGLVYYTIGDYDRAIATYQKALPLAQQIKDERGESAVLSGLGLIHSARKEWQRGIDYQQRSLALIRKLGDRAGEASMLANLGGAYRNANRLKDAIAAFEQSAAIMQELGDLPRQGRVLANLGSVHRNQRQIMKAIDYYQRSLGIAKRTGDRDLESYALFNLGFVHFESGKLAEAEQFLRSAITVRETQRQQLGQRDQLKVAIGDMEITADSYRYLQRVLVARKQPEAALEVAEWSRARAFADLVARRLGAAPNPALVEPPINLQSIRQIARQQKATIVEYSILDGGYDITAQGQGEGAELLIWVIQPTGQITLRRVAIGEMLQKSLPQLVSLSREQVGVRGKVSVVRVADSRTTDPDAPPPLNTLHQLLIDPIADLLPKQSSDRVIFVPQGALFLVPFAVLQDAQGRYLIEKHTLVTAPSIQVLELIGQAQKRGNSLANAPGSQQNPAALVVGNPTMPQLPARDGAEPEILESLPGTEQEAKEIADLLNTQPLLGAAATKAAVLQRISQAKTVHLATHGLLDDIDGVGMPGAIALAPEGQDDGFLTAREIMDLKLSAELVVLSACDTGRGQITGDGVIGLSRSLFAAGVPSVVVSLWQVPDTATAYLMTAFYRNLAQTTDKAQALRQAMLQTKEKYPDPRDWAAFMLMGEADAVSD